MIQLIFLLLSISSFCVLFNQILNQPEEIFSWKPKTVKSIVSLGRAEPMIKYSYNSFQIALIKILDSCPKCLSGWVSILVYTKHFSEEGIELVFGMICITIYFTYILQTLNRKYGE